MRVFSVLMVLFLIVIPAGAGAAGVSLYLGLQTVDFGSDIDSDYDIPTGAGPALTLGIRAIPGVPFDINLGLRNTSEEETRDDVEYRWVEVGPRFPFGGKGSRIQPEFFAGAGIYDLKIGDVDFDQAIGFYGGLGLEDFISDKMSGRLQVKGVFWKSDTGQTDGSSLNFSLMYGYHF